MPQESLRPPQWPDDRVCSADQKGLVREMLTRIGDKWTTLVITTLARGPLRFSALLGEINGLSHRMLTVTLRALERDGLVTRTVYAEVPPRVEYTLTDLGVTLIAPLGTIVDWVEGHQGQVAASRAEFDA
ncbi:transcriptional regulator [Frondihabitans sucicola]|uniref:Transcriptional regulator n=1 Tax=Frondihabitans sucicola TaxID=1268041 RepID=A0ABN6XYK6_9MICO|nr:helix-turn-helix domain-containing protein [Frondihabitans sucicola]BDZ48458.1 transcriptional regulator [Frondihabitans sucicola]